MRLPKFVVVLGLCLCLGCQTQETVESHICELGHMGWCWRCGLPKATCHDVYTSHGPSKEMTPCDRGAWYPKDPYVVPKEYQAPPTDLEKTEILTNSHGDTSNGN